MLRMLPIMALSTTDKLCPDVFLLIIALSYCLMLKIYLSMWVGAFTVILRDTQLSSTGTELVFNMVGIPGLSGSVQVL